MRILRRVCVNILLFLSVHNTWARVPIAHVDLLKGDVKYLVPGGVVHELRQGDSLSEKDTIFTGSDGRVRLIFEEGSSSQGNTVVIGPNSRLYILRASLPSESSGTELQLIEGSVRSSVYKKYSGRGKDVFEVRTPDVVAGVRGTVFQVDYDPSNRRSYVATLKGLVEVQNDLLRIKTPLRAGQFTSFSGNRLETPQRIQRDAPTQKRLKKFELESFEEEAKSEQASQQNTSKKALYNASNKTIAERNQIERAQKLSNQLGIPVEKTLGFVRSEGENRNNRDRAVRRLKELKTGTGAADDALANLAKANKIAPSNMSAREPASVVTPTIPDSSNSVTIQPPSMPPFSPRTDISPHQ